MTVQVLESETAGKFEELHVGERTTMTESRPSAEALRAVARRSADNRLRLGPPVVVPRSELQALPTGDDYAVWADVALEWARSIFDAAAEAWPEE